MSNINITVYNSKSTQEAAERAEVAVEKISGGQVVAYDNLEYVIAYGIDGKFKRLSKNDLKNGLTITSIELQPVAPGALVAGPAGQERKMEVSAVGTWTYGGSPVGSNADGYKTTFWWTGSTWVNNGSVRVKGDSSDVEVGTLNGNLPIVNNKYYKFETNVAVLTDLANYNYVRIPIVLGQNYKITTKSLGVGYPYYVVDEDYNILETSGAGSSTPDNFDISIHDEGAKWLIVNCQTANLDILSVRFISEEINFLEKQAVTDESGGIILSPLAGLSQTTSVNLSGGKVVFNYNPLFITARSGKFKIFPSDATTFELPVTTNTYICVKKSDLYQLNFGFTSPKYISYYTFNYTLNSDFMKDYIPLLMFGNLGQILDVYAVGRFYNQNNVLTGSYDSYITDKAPVVNQTIIKDGQKVTVSFSANPRITNELGQAAYLFPSGTTSFVLPELAAYGVLYIDNTLTSQSWATTPYLPSGSIKTASFLDSINLNKKTVLAINQTGDLMNFGAIGHKAHDDLTPAVNVKSAFPTEPTYFDLLREKCPTFHENFKNKNKDVVVCLTGTSLTQGNLYTTTRPDANRRPPLMHGYDLASLLWDKVSSYWMQQEYRRYDHPELTYSDSSWSTINALVVSDVEIWDDGGSDKNGLTKTTTTANASVTITVPADAWQFNFIYRTDSLSGIATVNLTEGNSKMEVFNGTSWVEANGYSFSMQESAATETKGNTCYQKRLKMRCKNKDIGGINSIGTPKTLTVSKGNNSNRFNVVGFEWSPREYMLTIINGARGSHQWGVNNIRNLERWQDSDIWEFNPDLLLVEATVINWGASTHDALIIDPLYYVNCAKRAYFNEFGDAPDSLFEKSEQYTKCDVVFYGDVLSAATTYATAWDATTHLPKFGTVASAATNGDTVDTRNVGRVKNNFENYEVVDEYMANKIDYIYIPVTNVFKRVSEKYYGTYWAGFQASSAGGNTLTIDGTHLNNNGAELWARMIVPLFDI